MVTVSGPLRVLGLMSGTSLDGLDLAACRIAVGPPLRHHFEALETVGFPQALALDLARLDALSLADLAHLDAALGRFFADAAAAFCRRHGFAPDLVGCHGQTVFHAGGAVTWQLGEPTFLAASLGCPVVARFRQADIALGGSGAPLVPFVDAVLFADPAEYRVALNIGGIANLTVLRPGTDPETVQSAFDTGPGNMVLDELARRASAGALSCDEDGAMAAAGEVDEAALADLLQHPFLRTTPPKSAGREQFGSDFVDRWIEETPALSWADRLATATAWTAASIAEAMRAHAPSATRLIVSGGGCRNPVLMDELARRVGNRVTVVTSDGLGVDPDGKEAIAFAILAAYRLAGIPTGVPACTGASTAARLGAIIEV